MSQHPTTKLARLDTVIANRLKAHAKEKPQRAILTQLDRDLKREVRRQLGR